MKTMYTGKLRFIIRDGERVLQQEILVWATFDEYDWRDVPLEVNYAASAPTTISCGYMEEIKV